MQFENKENIDEIDKYLYDYFDNNKEIPNETNKVIKETLHNKKNKYNFIHKVAIIILISSILSTGIVFAEDIFNFIKDIFNLNTININNNNVVNAIEEKGYVQNIEMEYISLNEEYKLKIDYLMLDDINLYILFNIYNENNLNNKYRLSLLDLKITDNNENIIYDSTKENNNTDTLTVSGWKDIENSEEHVQKELLFIMSNGFQNIKKLNIYFSKILLYDKEKPDSDVIVIDKVTTFCIDIIDKFIDRKVYKYNNIPYMNMDYNIKNIVTSDTGTYILLETTNPEINIIAIYNNKKYNSDKRLLGINANNNYEFIIYYDISNTDMENIKKLILEDSKSNKLILDKK